MISTIGDLRAFLSLFLYDGQIHRWSWGAVTNIFMLIITWNRRITASTNPCCSDELSAMVLRLYWFKRSTRLEVPFTVEMANCTCISLKLHACNVSVWSLNSYSSNSKIGLNMESEFNWNTYDLASFSWISFMLLAHGEWGWIVSLGVKVSECVYSDSNSLENNLYMVYLIIETTNSSIILANTNRT